MFHCLGEKAGVTICKGRTPWHKQQEEYIRRFSAVIKVSSADASSSETMSVWERGDLDMLQIWLSGRSETAARNDRQVAV
jgi:hypothetical protein